MKQSVLQIYKTQTTEQYLNYQCLNNTRCWLRCRFVLHINLAFSQH